MQCIVGTVGGAWYQKGLVELKRAGKLPLQLVYAVQPLQEDGTALVHVLGIFPMSTAVRKLMSEIQPLSFHQNLETLQRLKKTQSHQVCLLTSTKSRRWKYI